MLAWLIYLLFLRQSVSTPIGNFLLAGAKVHALCAPGRALMHDLACADEACRLNLLSTSNGGCCNILVRKSKPYVPLAMLRESA